MKAIILAGGFGTRLRSITGEEIPKCMVKGWFKPGHREIPWLEIIIRNLKSYGITDITLALHYKPQVFIDWFGDKLKYKIEEQPLGTGGAIRNCLEDTEPTLVLNGDTISSCDFNEMLIHHQPPLTMATVETEKGWISAGIYILNSGLFITAPVGAFSFEEFIKDKPKVHYPIAWFSDMGTPEGYQRVQHDAG